MEKSTAPTVDHVSELLVRTGLLPEGETQGLRERWRSDAGPAGDAAAFAAWLVKHQHLTAYQADRLLRGQADHYFFGPYKLLDRLGQGRMAGVYKAVHRLGQVVAIKVLPPKQAKDPETFGRFQREARLALPLKHPNVVRTFQTGVADGLHYLVMEYLDGETLEEVLKRRGRVPADEAVRLLYQAFQGLSHLHEKGMVHRDLKPANLMLVSSQPDSTREATLKILDIGLGRALFDEADAAAGQAELTTAGELLGTPDYVAPEQARDAHTADVRADIYSLGCVLYHALTGQPPFPGGTTYQKLVRHAKETPRPLREFDQAPPIGLQVVLDHLLAKDPAQRYPSPEQAATALGEILAGSWKPPSTAPQPLAAYETWLQAQDAAPPQSPGQIDAQMTPRKAGHNRHSGRLVLTGAAVAILVLFGVCAVLWLNQPAGPVAQAPTRPVTPTLPTRPWAEQVRDLPPEKQVQAVVARLQQLNPGFDGQVKYASEDGAVAELEFVSDQITDLGPVRALTGLKRLVCTGSSPGRGQLADLTPLRDLSLAVLDCSFNKVSDLSPLAGMPLVYLGVGGNPVRSLAALRGLPLVALVCTGTHVTDLAPLRGLPLTLLDAADAPVSDLSPLRGLPLEALWAEVQPQRDADLMRSLPALAEINGKSAAEFWKEADALRKSFEGWIQQVAALPAEKQADAVAAKLKELNPGFHGTMESTVEGGSVTALRLLTDTVTDLSPLQALPGLKRLSCNGSAPGKGKLASLEPLRGLPLTELDCGWTQVSDLGPLRDMPLTRLLLAGDTGVADLAPLKGRPLTHLQLDGNRQISDLGPLRGMPLSWLNVAGTQVRDLAPLRELPLTSLALHGTSVTDLSPLKGLALKMLWCDIQPLRDGDVLHTLNALERLNSKPAAEVLKGLDAQRQAVETFAKRIAALPAQEQVAEVAAALRERNPDFDGRLFPRVENGAVVELQLSADAVTDLTPLRALPALARLGCRGSAPGKGRLADLWPLHRLPLKALLLPGTVVETLAPLAGMPLEELDLAGTPVRDLSDLKGLPLRSLNIAGTRVNDLTPLTSLSLREVRCDLKTVEHLAALRSISSLAAINGQSPEKAGQTTELPARPISPAIERPAPTVKFFAKVLRLQPAERRLTVQLDQPIVVLNPSAAWHLARSRRGLLKAAQIRDPIHRAHAVQSHLLAIAKHQAKLYSRHDLHQSIDLEAGADVPVRSRKPPPFFDNKGNLRQPTAKELKELRDPDPKVKTYRSTWDRLAPHQAVEVHIEHGKEAEGAAARDLARVALIVILD